jgi:DNA polymerase-3 subunit delta'
VQTRALDLGLQLVSLWFADLAFVAYGAGDLVRNRDRLAELEAHAGCDPARLRDAIELVEDTRERFLLNVSEDLACEALAYRLAQTLRR